MPGAYYNEIDPGAAAWLRELIRRGLIADGDVDERSICDVQPDDVSGYVQCHWFAGIGGWSRALRIAGWPDDRAIWTGSCPCQPFSDAGKQQAQADERHLWPDMFRLARECKPVVIVGEQVEGAIRHGWLDGICADLEGEGYAVGSVVLGAHSIGAPHIRQRLFWVADAGHIKSRARHYATESMETSERTQSGIDSATNGMDGRLADAAGTRGPEHVHDARERSGGGSNHTAERHRPSRMGDAIEPRPQGFSGYGKNGREPGRIDTPAGGSTADTSPTGFWSDYELIPCSDGKARRIESGTFPLAHGIPARVGRLRGYGNAIVPQLAAEFIQAYCEI